MIRHYCDVCKKEVECFEVNNLIMTMKKQLNIRGLIVADREINYELCDKCAEKIAFYVTQKCKEDN